MRIMNDKEVFKTALCWTMGIIMFLVIFIYDTKRVDLTLELEKKVETIPKEWAAVRQEWAAVRQEWTAKCKGWDAVAVRQEWNAVRQEYNSQMKKLNDKVALMTELQDQVEVLKTQVKDINQTETTKRKTRHR